MVWCDCIKKGIDPMAQIVLIVVLSISFLAQMLGMQTDKQPLSLYQSIQEGKELTITPLDVEFCDSQVLMP